MHPPPLDEQGAVKPHDCAEIHDAHILIRRIDPSQHVVDDENRQCMRISSKAIQPSSVPNGGMSVDLHQRLVDADVDPAGFVTTPKHVGSLQFEVSAARNTDLLVGCEPLADNPYHGEVWGAERPNRFSKSQQKAILSACSWLVPIDNVQIVPA